MSNILLCKSTPIVALVDFENGQKTGYFLDQKYNRLKVREFTKNRTVLDCCTHTGSFAMNAAMGGAKKVVALDANGKKTKPEISVNQEKITEDLKFAGYNMLVTSEIDMNPQEIYSVYHNLWKIEESFRITKSFLDARPVYVQKKETIYGHFLICYLSLFLLRVLELKCFKGEVSTYDLIEFIRDFRVVDKGDDAYINISSNQVANSKIKKLTGSSLLDALILTKKEIHNLFNNTMLIDP